MELMNNLYVVVCNNEFDSGINVIYVTVDRDEAINMMLADVKRNLTDTLSYYKCDALAEDLINCAKASNGVVKLWGHDGPVVAIKTHMDDMICYNTGYETAVYWHIHTIANDMIKANETDILGGKEEYNHNVSLKNGTVYMVSGSNSHGEHHVDSRYNIYEDACKAMLDLIEKELMLPFPDTDKNWEAVKEIKDHLAYIMDENIHTMNMNKRVPTETGYIEVIVNKTTITDDDRGYPNVNITSTILDCDKNCIQKNEWRFASYMIEEGDDFFI